MKNKSVEPKTKQYQAKKKEGDFSQFSNLNPNCPKDSQTVSKKKLIRGILHSFDGNPHKLADPIDSLDTNINLLAARHKKEGTSQEVITELKLNARNKN